MGFSTVYISVQKCAVVNEFARLQDHIYAVLKSRFCVNRSSILSCNGVLIFRWLKGNGTGCALKCPENAL